MLTREELIGLKEELKAELEKTESKERRKSIEEEISSIGRILDTEIRDN